MSSGKTALVNKLLGKRIFKSRQTQSTATICKIRNSVRIKIITEDMSGQKNELDLTDKCRLDTKEGEKLLRDHLNDLTDMFASEKSKEYKSVDIGFPIPFLRVL